MKRTTKFTATSVLALALAGGVATVAIAQPDDENPSQIVLAQPDDTITPTTTQPDAPRSPATTEPTANQTAGDRTADVSPDLERAATAAAAEVGDGTVTAIEHDRGGYDVEIRLPDGTEVDVALDDGFAVVRTHVDDHDRDNDDDDD